MHLELQTKHLDKQPSGSTSHTCSFSEDDCHRLAMRCHINVFASYELILLLAYHVQIYSTRCMCIGLSGRLPDLPEALQLNLITVNCFASDIHTSMVNRKQTELDSTDFTYHCNYYYYFCCLKCVQCLYTCPDRKKTEAGRKNSRCQPRGKKSPVELLSNLQ